MDYFQFLTFILSSRVSHLVAMTYKRFTNEYLLVSVSWLKSKRVQYVDAYSGCIDTRKLTQGHLLRVGKYFLHEE